MKNPRLGCGGQKTTRQGELYADPTLCDKIVKGPQDIFIQVAARLLVTVIQPNLVHLHSSML